MRIGERTANHPGTFSSMPITIAAPPSSQGPDGNRLTWIHLKLSATPSADWVAAFTAAGEAMRATDRPSHFLVEGDEIQFAFNQNAEPDDGEDHEMLRYLEAVRGWVDAANQACPNG
jgi:hypothetical protein